MLYTKSSLRNLIFHLKSEFIKNSALLNITGESSDQFPLRWVAERRMASFILHLDGGKTINVELPT